LTGARSALRDAKLDACLITAPENVLYLGGCDSWVGVNSPQFMIPTPGRDAPTIVLRNVDQGRPDRRGTRLGARDLVHR